MLSLFYFCEKVFSHMTIWIRIQKSSMKRYFKTRKILKDTKHGRYYWCRLHTKKVCKDCEKENLGEYHDLNIQSGALCTWELII